MDDPWGVLAAQQRQHETKLPAGRDRGPLYDIVLIGSLGLVLLIAIAWFALRPTSANSRPPHTGEVTTADARSTSWTPTFSDLSTGDVLCGGGTVTNNLLLDKQGRLIPVGPNGIDLQTIDGFTRYDVRFPMMAFLGRVDRNPSKTFVIRDGCHAAPFVGRDFEIMANVPMKDEHGFMNSGQATHHNLGNFTFTRRAATVVEPQAPPQAPTQKLKITRIRP